MKRAKADEARERGNDSMKANRPTEAFFHYTEAIKLNPADHRAYSNRSLAFLKIDQHYHALDDARKAVQLEPDWPKGYFRRGEVEFETGHYEYAVKSYEQAVRLNDKDPKLQEALQKARNELKKVKAAEFRIPCICTAVGLAVGVLVLLGDIYLASKPSFSFLFLQIILVVIFGLLGYCASFCYFFVLTTYRNAMIQAPTESKGEDKAKVEQQTQDILNMFTKSSKGVSPGKTPTETTGETRQRKKPPKTS